MTTAPPWAISAQMGAQTGMEVARTVGSGPIMLEETIPRGNTAIRPG